MTELAELAKRELDWSAPDAERHCFVLRADGEEIGRLEFASGEGEPSLGELNGRPWTFEYHDLLNPHITVRDGRTGEAIARSEPRWKGGMGIVFTSGARYHWASANIWGTKWCFRREQDNSTVCLSLQSNSLKSGGKVTICCGAARLDEAPVLMLLAWYVRVLAFERLAEEIFAIG